MNDQTHQVGAKSDGNKSSRRPDGTFAPGHKFSQGNSGGRRSQQLRAVLLDALTHEDLRIISRKLIDGAKDGQLSFIREILDRLCGKSITQDLEERLSALEDSLKLQKEGAQ
jgi:hypothetical protein